LFIEASPILGDCTLFFGSERNDRWIAAASAMGVNSRSIRSFRTRETKQLDLFTVYSQRKTIRPALIGARRINGPITMPENRPVNARLLRFR